MASTWGMPTMPFGGDYKPELWPEHVWVEDVALTSEAGVNWLNRVLDLLHAAGFRVGLATATASPPPWLARRYPKIVPVDERGARYSLGSRQTWCPSSPVYREHSLEFVERMAGRYADHPAVTMWHVSNELGCHNARCYCPVGAAHFRFWLEQRYEDLDTLNEAWGTTCWSQVCGDSDEIDPPVGARRSAGTTW